ncbi:MAG: 3-deoxy-D-manno-octulosonic acid kinase, partial [Phototrophicales bacterium]
MSTSYTTDLPASTLCESSQAPYFWLYDPTRVDKINTQHFSPAYWKDQQAISRTEMGRGSTLFIQHNNNNWVLRHYLRGGMAGKLSHDNYLYCNLSRTRSFAELRLLKLLEHLKLPAPRPVAAQVTKRGLLYQADILTQEIPNARDLVYILAQKQNEAFYQGLGQTIARFHLAGIDHADLNIKNIMQDQH